MSSWFPARVRVDRELRPLHHFAWIAGIQEPSDPGMKAEACFCLQARYLRRVRSKCDIQCQYKSKKALRVIPRRPKDARTPQRNSQGAQGPKRSPRPQGSQRHSKDFDRKPKGRYMISKLPISRPRGPHVMACSTAPRRRKVTMATEPPAPAASG